MPIELSGMDQLLARLQRTTQNVAAVKKKALKKGAKIIQAEIKTRAPVDTGFLKDHIVISEKVGVDAVDVGPGKEVYYAKMLEFGTKKMAAKPFIEPAYLAKRAEAKEAIAEAIREAINDV